MKQVVQVQILGAVRKYTYEWEFDPPATMPLAVGDKVEIPPNQVQEEGSSATVVALGSDYSGPMKAIVRKIKSAEEIESERVRAVVNSWPGATNSEKGDVLGADKGYIPPDDGLWEGFGTGDYA